MSDGSGLWIGWCTGGVWIIDWSVGRNIWIVNWVAGGGNSEGILIGGLADCGGGVAGGIIVGNARVKCNCWSIVILSLLRLWKFLNIILIALKKFIFIHRADGI